MPVTLNSVLQVLIFLIIVLLVTKPIGLYLTRVFAGERTWLSPVCVPIERLFYRLSGVNPEEEQKWTGYMIAVLVFSLVGMLLLYLLERSQQWHGLLFNPQNLPNVEPQLAFNTASSFTTNTNWQNYTGEQTMSYLTQMAGLTFHQFVSAAAGIALAVALVRGLARRSAQHLGNFWVDLVRCTLYILLPICIVGALIFVSQGMIQNFSPYTVVHTLNGQTQVIAQGPVASMEIIKDLGTNGGGFFNVNAAHPFENPNAFTALLIILCEISLGAGLFYMFGKMVGDTRQGWVLWIASAILFVVGLAVVIPAEQTGNPLLTRVGADQVVSDTQAGGNMEGKEVRYGITVSSLQEVTTTATSTGTVMSFHDSYTPLGGLVLITNIALGEIIFGGVGAGLYSMIYFAIIAVFIAGLMVGRTPEYLGKKIERKEIMMAVLALLVSPVLVLGFTGVAMALPQGLAGIANSGPHGLTEVLYAYTSANGNNGSAFAGLSGNTPFYNWTLGMVMLIGRFAEVIPILAFAGSLVQKRVVPAGLGTFPTTGSLFVALLIGVILIVGALTYFPAYSLGPIVEHLLMYAGGRSEMHTQTQPDSLEVKQWKTRRKGDISIWDPRIIRAAIPESFKKLDPRVQLKNPVMFVVEVGSLIATIEFVRLLFTAPTPPFPRTQLTYETIFVLAVAVWLWFTVVFANFAEAMAEGRGKAQAETLRRARTTTMAKRLASRDRFGKVEEVAAPELRKGDLVLVEAGDAIPGDGDVVEGVASVDESAITGESAPVIRESGGDRSAVTGGTRVLSDWIVVQISANPGETFLDRMIALVEGAKRQRTPNEIALNILIASLTIIFVLVVVSLEPFAIYSGQPVSVTTLIALLVCLIPTTIGGLLSAIGIAGMDRLVQRNVLAMSGRAVEAAGDVDVLLLDKTGTITLGNRQATRFVPLHGVDEREVAHAAMLSSLSDETPEGRSIVELAKERYGFSDEVAPGTTFIPFSAMTRMSGVDTCSQSLSPRQGDRHSTFSKQAGDGAAPVQTIRKGASDAVVAYVAEHGGTSSEELRVIVNGIASVGSTPLVVAETQAGSNGTRERARVLGVIELKDIVKGGMRARFDELRKMGIRTIMITGDNPLTAAAIAKESGVDDFLAQATPETKMKLIREQQSGGRLVAMTGDGTNDAPALAQADVGVAMNTGTQAAKEAANMVDLDSNPTKLIEVVEVGKQLLITRGALTTFSIANDVAKYFAIIPAAFSITYPQLQALNVMQLATPHSAVLSAVIFNALIIIALIPLALRGVKYRPIGAGPLLQRNLLIYGIGGIIVPFIFIKAIDVILQVLHLTL